MSTNPKPDPAAAPTPTSYPEWLASKLGVTLDEPVRNLANTNGALILNSAQKSSFFEDLPYVLEECSAAYEKQTGSPLLTRAPSDFTLRVKPFESMVDKSFRQNVVWNKRWPSNPRLTLGTMKMEEWVTPSNWHLAFDDIVRGTLVLRYIDGPSFLSAWLTDEATSRGLTTRVEARALDDGYYAYHFYVQLVVEMFKSDWSMFSGKLWIEIQLTTQLQEVARDLSHGFYAERRVQPRGETAWKWEYTSPRFKSAYISHTLHLIEGLIVELRDGLVALDVDHNGDPSTPPSAEALTTSPEVESPNLPPAVVGKDPS